MPIYVDNNATTPLAKEVIEAIQEAYTHFGNPSSTHSHGQKAKNLITKARRTIAAFLQVDPQEIFFTSGATEGLNFLIRPTGHCITSSIEHPCVLSLFERHKETTYLSPKEDGIISAGQVTAAIRPDTALIAIMAANNETGVINEWTEIATVAERYGIPFIVDGVALLGKKPFKIPKGVIGMAFSGHKIHAPKGIGFIYLRKGTKMNPLVLGGGQERGYRGGTENVPGIWALAKAIELIDYEMMVRDAFEKEVLEQIPDTIVNGTGPRVSNTSNISFLGVDGESLLLNLDLEGVSASSGSACSSGALEPSRVLTNMGLPKSRVSTAVRFSFSRYNTLDEVHHLIHLLKSLVSRLRA